MRNSFPSSHRHWILLASKTVQIKYLFLCPKAVSSGWPFMSRILYSSGSLHSQLHVIEISCIMCVPRTSQATLPVAWIPPVIHVFTLRGSFHPLKYAGMKQFIPRTGWTNTGMKQELSLIACVVQFCPKIIMSITFPIHYNFPKLISFILS